MIDMDDYINNLISKIDNLEQLNTSLKQEIKTQRKEIAQLREERRMIINNDLPLGYDPEWNIPDNEDDASRLGLK
jgi:hypothetical protein